MRRYIALALLLLVAVAAGPSLARGRAQEDARVEAARIERRLSQIEARVLATDAEVRDMNEALGAELLAAMEAISPGVGEDARRLAVLRAPSVEARDEEAAAEARRLEASVDAARSAALRQERLAVMVEAFTHLLREKMIRADPETAPLLRRYGELHGISDAADP